MSDQDKRTPNGDQEPAARPDPGNAAAAPDPAPGPAPDPSPGAAQDSTPDSAKIDPVEAETEPSDTGEPADPPVIEGEFTEAKGEDPQQAGGPGSKAEAAPKAAKSQSAAAARRSKPSPKAKAKPKSGGGRLGWTAALLLLGVIGGVYAAPHLQDGLAALGLDNVFPGPQTATDQAALEQMGNRLDSLNAEIRALESRAVTAGMLERQMAELTPRGVPPETQQRIARLEERLRETQQTLQALGQEDVGEAAAQLRAAQAESLSDVRDRLTALEDRLAAMDEGLTTLQEGQGTQQRLATRVADLEAALEARPDDPVTRQELKQTAQDLRQIPDAVAGQIDALEQRLTEGRESLNRRIVALEIEGKRDASAPDLTYEIAQLQRTLVAGAPYRGDLSAIAALVEQDPLRLSASQSALKRLEAAADQGIATVPELRRQFQDLIAAAEEAAQGPDASGSLWGRVRSQAESLVKVRPSDASRGAGVDALLARIDDALVDGDVAGAVALVGRLPDAAQQTLKPFNRAAQQRIDSLAAVETLFAVVRASEGEDA